MRYAKLTAIAMLAVCTASASAATNPVTFSDTIMLDSSSSDFGNTYNGPTAVGSTFLDAYTFVLSSQADVDAGVFSFATKPKFDLNITSFKLFSGASLIASGVEELDGKTDVWTLGGVNLTSGNYSLQIGGTFLGDSGGSYAGTINVSPVPEAETWGLMGFGIVTVGFMARRRKSTGAIPSGLAA